MFFNLKLLIVLCLICIWWKLFNTLPAHNITKHFFKNNQYLIFEIDNLLNKDECDLLIKHANPRLERSSTISSTPISNVRTSYNTFLHSKDHSLSSDVKNILHKIDTITNKLSGKPVENQEPLQIVKYSPHQEYKSHYDCCVPMNSPMCLNDAKSHGYRHSTLLIYMNDVDIGGETEFPLLNYKFTPKLGKAIFFFNLTKNEDSFHTLSKHAGLPPTHGDKWICNKWIRTQPY